MKGFDYVVPGLAVAVFLQNFIVKPVDFGQRWSLVVSSDQDDFGWI